LPHWLFNAITTDEIGQVVRVDITCTGNSHNSPRVISQGYDNITDINWSGRSKGERTMDRETGVEKSVVEPPKVSARRGLVKGALRMALETSGLVGAPINDSKLPEKELSQGMLRLAFGASGLIRGSSSDAIAR